MWEINRIKTGLWCWPKNEILNILVVYLLFNIQAAHLDYTIKQEPTTLDIFLTLYCSAIVFLQLSLKGGSSGVFTEQLCFSIYYFINN